ncbi:histone deacetylase [bacterium]|nr:histone deacetylase [bacterium]
MILSIENSNARLQDYGIQIPLLAERYTKTLEALEQHAKLSQCKDKWLLTANTKPLSREQLLRVHTQSYVEALLSENPLRVMGEVFEFIDSGGHFNERFVEHENNRPLSELVEKRLAHAAGTLVACETALAQGFCYFLGGGAHHAMTTGGRGFCLVHDLLIAVRELQARGQVKTVWVIDLDAHKGDGTAEITIADPSVLTLSIHMQEGWPLDESPLDDQGQLKRCFWPSTVDIPVPIGAESAYLELLRHGLQQLEVCAGGRLPDLALVVDGSDPFEKDVLQSAKLMQLSLEQCVDRTRLVHDWLQERGVPQAYVMAGGYGPENWRVHAGFLLDILPRRIFG